MRAVATLCIEDIDYINMLANISSGRAKFFGFKVVPRVDILCEHAGKVDPRDASAKPFVWKNAVRDEEAWEEILKRTC